MSKLGIAIALVALAVLVPVSALLADDFPQYTVDRMCDMAELIVKGETIGDNKVQIDRSYKTPEGWDDARTEITVEELDKHNKKLHTRLGRLEEEEIETTSVVLFLTRKQGVEDEIWQSIATITDDGLTGSCGLFWIDNDACYGYYQWMNPGSYVLSTGKDYRYRIPATAADLDQQIETGFKNWKRYRAVLAMIGGPKKARELAKYLLPRTSPKGDRGTFRQMVREPLVKHGRTAVPVLIDVIRTAEPEDSVLMTVSILGEIGPAATEAVPLLCELLGEAEDPCLQAHIISALGRIGDKRAIPDVRKMLTQGRFGLRTQAATSLSSLGDAESFEDIASLIAGSVDRGDVYDAMSVLRALHALDPEKAKPIIEAAVTRDDLAEVRRQIEDLAK